MKHSVPLDKSKDETNWATARRVHFPNLKPSSTAISLRLPNTILNRLKVDANRLGVSYQAYLKMKLAESLGLGGNPPRKTKKAA